MLLTTTIVQLCTTTTVSLPTASACLLKKKGLASTGIDDFEVSITKDPNSSRDAKHTEDMSAERVEVHCRRLRLSGKAMQSPALLGRSAARAALQPSAHTRDQAFGYGQHWQVFRARPGAPFRTGEQRPLFGHGGSDGTFAIADPERDWIACYFTQSRGNRTTPEMIRMLCALFE